MYNISDQLKYQDVILLGCQSVSKTSQVNSKMSWSVLKWSDMWTSCRILLCVIQNNPSPFTPSSTHRCCQSIWRTRWTTQFIRCSHMPLCVSHMFIPKQWMNWFVFVCLLVCLFLDCLFHCVCVMGLRIGVANQKKNAQLPLKDNGTMIDKVRTCIKCCWKWRTR